MSETRVTQKMIDHAVAAIRADGLEGVSTFSELHDHVDANEYLVDALEDSGVPCDADEFQVANDLADRLNALLPLGPVETNWNA